MKLLLTLILIFLFNNAKTEEPTDMEFYERRYNFLKKYIEQLKIYKKKDIKTKGSVVETLSGSFL